MINDNNETVTCRICGEQCKRIYGKHLKFAHNDISTNEYKSMYPGAPIMALSDKGNTSKNSGKHMKDEKYKKMFSEKMKGSKNPNHKNNTTEFERKSRSPFSKDFINYEGIENVEEHISLFAKESIKDRVSDTTLEYYLLKGYSEDESINMLKNRQTTFSLDKCITKYGEVDGRKRWADRQEKWQRNLLENGNMKCGYSKISQELFDNILLEYVGNYDKIYYATLNKEYYISKKDIGFFAYDYVDISTKKIIEFNGDVYHANPLKYSSEDYHHPFYKENGPMARETWNRDELKINLAKSEGFEVLVVWDSEYKQSKKETIKKCLNFLKNA